MKDKVIKRGLSIAFVILFLFFIYILNITLEYEKPGDAEIGVTYEKARVINIISEEFGNDPTYDFIEIGKQVLELEILTGDNKGKIIEFINFVGRVDNRPAKVGTKVVVSSYDEFTTGMIVNYSRENYIYLLVIIFIAVVLYFGRMKGLKSIFSLVFTIVSIIFLFIPLLIKGVHPINASVITVILSTVVTMLSINGLSKKTMATTISCILCTVIAGIIAYIFGNVTYISTLNTAEAEELLFVTAGTGMNIRSLLFAGILIASMGAIMDTTMSIASSIFEMHEVSPHLTPKQLYNSGINVGRDVMGTMTNTLILAFTGSSINIIIIYFMYNMKYLKLINIDLIVIEIIKGLSGGIAIILSMPITAIIAVSLIANKNIITSENIR